MIYYHACSNTMVCLFLLWQSIDMQTAEPQRAIRPVYKPQRSQDTAFVSLTLLQPRWAPQFSPCWAALTLRRAEGRCLQADVCSTLTRTAPAPERFGEGSGMLGPDLAAALQHTSKRQGHQGEVPGFP